jgi:hypothetical protein
MKQPNPDFALLAPVPLEHLLSGASVAAAAGKVAFGSMAWELFREVDTLRQGQSVDVFIYASHAAGVPVLAATWRGVYVGHVVSQGGMHPAGMQFRPPTTAKYPHDNSGYWAVFWEVADLGQLPPNSQLPIRTLRGYKSGKRFVSSFIPEGPLLIHHP